MTFREVNLAIKGHYEQGKFYHDLLRFATSLIVASGSNHKVAQRFTKLWPSEKKSVDISRAKETLRKLAEIEAKKTAREKLGRT